MKCKKILSVLLVLVMVLGMLPMAAAASAGSISELKVNDLVQPLGVDTNPVFRWLVELDGFNKSQSAYRIIVASSAEKAAAREGDLWDSGKVADSDNFDVKYAGAALESRTPYYWAVQVWDETDASIGWSDVACFETGVLNEREWTAQWISAKQGELDTVTAALDGANWIWSRYGAAQDKVPAETMYFRSSFTLEDKAVKSALLGFTTDDYGTVYINGQAAGAVPNEAEAWRGGSLTDVTELVKAGVNVIAADTTNYAAGYAGFIAKLMVTYADGTEVSFVTDGSWKLTKNPGEGWQNENYDASSWETPDQVLRYGSSPWGHNVSLLLKKPSEEVFSAPMVRKEFSIEKEVARARAYVSGMGLFELTVNGQLPDDSVLNPAHTQYEDTVNYRVFDVTGLLNRGENALAAMVGNSFYNCIIQTWQWPDAIWRDYAKFMMELVIEYTDGTSETIVTDDSWKSYHKGPIVRNDIYIGETYDARLEVSGWELASFDDGAWEAAVVEDAPAGKLTFENMEPMRRVQTFTPAVTKTGEGRYLLRNPEMTTGWAKIAFDAPAGTEITITYAETVSGNSLNKVSMEGHTFQSDVYICKGVPGETYEPKFSYKGYEYIQIEGYPGELTADDVECYLIATDSALISTFDTSSQQINDLHAIMQRTMRNNMQGKPTDTPVWEKNGWTGDYNVSLRSFNYNFDTAAFNTKFLGDLRDSADSRGVVPNISPTANWGMGNTPVWNTVYINSIYEAWKSMGQVSVMEDHYDAMRKQAIAYIDDIRGNGWVWNDWQLSDWVAPDGDASSSEGSGICATAYVYLALNRMAEMADFLGKTADAAEYRTANERIYTAFNAKFYNAEKGCYETTTWSDPGGQRTRYRQTSNLVPLAFGLCPEEYRASVLASLLDHIVNVKGSHLDTGMVGTQLILPVLSQQGNADLAMTLLTQTTYPSWGHWLENGSTSTWEAYGGPRSRNHYFLGTYDEWLYAYLAGIRDYSNGYETVTIDPYITGELSYVRCSLDTVRGKLSSSWQITDEITMSVTVPTGTTATVWMPASDPAVVSGSEAALTAENGRVKAVLGSGDYTFTMPATGVAVSKSELRNAVSEAKAMDEIHYPVGLFNAVRELLVRAEALLSDETADQGAINAMAAELNAAIEAAEQNRMGNLALGKTVKASSAINSMGWSSAGLVDGVTKGTSVTAQVQGWTSNNDTANDHEEWVQVDLGRSYAIAKVKLFAAGQRGNVGAVSYGFPKDFVIEVSENGKDWQAVVTETNYPAPVVEVEGETPVRTFTFAEAAARYVRVRGTSLNQLVHDGNLYRMQLAELEVYNNKADKTELLALLESCKALDESVYPAANWKEFQLVVTNATDLARDDSVSAEQVNAMVKELKAAMEVLANSIPKNLALGKNTTVSSTLDQTPGTGWHRANLTDGDQKNVNQWGQFGGWTSNNTISVNHEEWACVDFGAATTFNKVILAPAGYSPNAGATIYGFPKDLVLEVSDDGNAWTTAYAENDIAPLTVTTAKVVPAQTYDFEEVTARYLRVRAADLHALVNDGNTYRMQLAEIEAYYFPADDPAGDVDALIDAINLADKATVEAARAAFDALSEADKALVTKLDKLLTAEADLEVMESIVKLSMTGSETVGFDPVTYTISAKEMQNLANFVMTVEYSAQLNLTAVEAVGDWVVEYHAMDGKVVVGGMHLTGASGDADLLKLTFEPVESGEAEVRVTKADLTAFTSDNETFVDADLADAWLHLLVNCNPFDVNRDGVINQLDLTRAQRYYGTNNPLADFNGDGRVAIDDLILLLTQILG